jgi:hypothetical protein
MTGERLLLLKLLGRDFLDNWPTWKNKFLRSMTKWRNRFLANLSKLLVLALCVWGGYVVFLYYLQSIWVVFADTPMGKTFATQVSPGIVAAITGVIAMELPQVAYACVINTLLITVPVGFLLKFSGLYRLTYLNRGLSGAIFWGIVCAAASAKFFPIVGSSAYLQGNALIYFLPSVGLLNGSFGFSAWLVPEFTVVFELVEFLRERVQIIRIRDLPYYRQ